MDCVDHGVVFHKRDNIWRCLSHKRERQLARFIHEYETVRFAEGRGSNEASWYRMLPETRQDELFSKDWWIRARSYSELIKQIIAPLEDREQRALTILDMGAGNGWLSNRLAKREHSLIAVDMLINTRDGLGANQHYLTEFTCVQAEFDAVPLSDNQVDIVIFNGSLHYSVDYNFTLCEALRLLKPDGTIVIMDSPIYHDGQSGDQMAQERAAAFEQAYGTRSDSITSEHYLTYARLNELGEILNLKRGSRVCCTSTTSAGPRS